MHRFETAQESCSALSRKFCSKSSTTSTVSHFGSCFQKSFNFIAYCQLSDKENLKPDQDLKVTLLNSFLVKAKVLPRLLLLFHPGLFIHTTKHVNTFHGLVYLTPVISRSDSLQYSEETLSLGLIRSSEILHVHVVTHRSCSEANSEFYLEQEK